MANEHTPAPVAQRYIEDSFNESYSEFHITINFRRNRDADVDEYLSHYSMYDRRSAKLSQTRVLVDCINPPPGTDSGACRRS